MTQKLLAVPLALALLGVLAVDTASCGPTCPTLQGCSTVSAVAGSAGAAGASSSATCPALTALQTCFDSFCQPSNKNPFCTCYAGHLDLGADCTCSAFDPAGYCQQAADNEVDAAAFDCAAATSGVSSLCVPVQ